MFSFVAPRGSQFVQWQDHCELRFAKESGAEVLQWWKDQLALLESQLPVLCGEVVSAKCTKCENGQLLVNGTVTVCPDCFGSGIANFVPVGHQKPVQVVEKPIAAPTPQAQVLASAIPQVKHPGDDVEITSAPTVPAPMTFDQPIETASVPPVNLSEVKGGTMRPSLTPLKEFGE